MTNITVRGRIDDSNLDNYLAATYSKEYTLCTSKKIACKPIIQDRHSQLKDAMLVAITTVLNQKLKGIYSVNQLYSIIESAAKGCHVNEEKYGVTPRAIKMIVAKAAKKLTIEMSAISAFKKGIGFTVDDIFSQLRRNNLVILSISDDGREFYHYQPVVVVGYKVFAIEGTEVTLLEVLDGQDNVVSYIDYSLLSSKCSISYLKK